MRSVTLYLVALQLQAVQDFETIGMPEGQGVVGMDHLTLSWEKIKQQNRSPSQVFEVYYWSGQGQKEMAGKEPAQSCCLCAGDMIEIK